MPIEKTNITINKDELTEIIRALWESHTLYNNCIKDSEGESDAYNCIDDHQGIEDYQEDNTYNNFKDQLNVVNKLIKRLEKKENKFN